MAKNQAAPSAPTTPVLVTRPGLKKFTGDVVGFHDFEKQGHLYGIPRGAKASDSKINTEYPKPSLFIIFELLEDCKVFEGTGDDTAEILAKKGEMVGVWTKGGMRPLRNMLGLQVLMQYTGEKVLKGRPKGQDPMKTYAFDTDFDAKTNPGGLIPIIEDSRKDSRDMPTFLDVKKPGKPGDKTAERQPGEDDEEPYDFPAA